MVVFLLHEKHRSSSDVDLIYGALDILILRTLLWRPTHGHGIAKSIERLSQDALKVEHGSLYPALQRLLQEGWIKANWGRLVSGFETEAAPGDYPVNHWQNRNHTFDSTSGYSWTSPYSIAGQGEAVAASGTEVQADFFQTLGIQPMLGRSFAHGEDTAGNNRVAVLSFGFWKSQFGGDRNILGKTLTLDADRYTVVGVTPPMFHFPAGNDVWIPFNMQSARFKQRGNHGIRVVGRMKPGITFAQACQDLLNISLQLEREFPITTKTSTPF